MRLKECFITYENGDDTILMDSSAEFSGLAHSNRTAAFIIDCLKTETTIREIADKMLDRFDATEAQVTDSINDVVSALKSINALE